MTKKGELMIRQPDSLQLARPQLQPDKFVTPSADIIETSDEYIVNVEMPGASQETVKVTIDSDLLTVQSLISEYHRAGGTLHRNELTKSNYRRTFHLGRGVNRQKISAEYRNGILTVKLHKIDNFKAINITIK